MSEPRNADLERLILEDPEDEAGFRVYGDWLLGQGHVRGELIALCRSNAQVAPPQIDAFIAAHPELWDTILPYGNVVGSVRWRLGFIDRVELSDRRAMPRQSNTDSTSRTVRSTRAISPGSPPQGLCSRRE